MTGNRQLERHDPMRPSEGADPSSNQTFAALRAPDDSFGAREIVPPLERAESSQVAPTGRPTVIWEGQPSAPALRYEPPFAAPEAVRASTRGR